MSPNFRVVEIPLSNRGEMVQLYEDLNEALETLPIGKALEIPAEGKDNAKKMQQGITSAFHSGRYRGTYRIHTQITDSSVVVWKDGAE